MSTQTTPLIARDTCEWCNRSRYAANCGFETGQGCAAEIAAARPGDIVSLHVCVQRPSARREEDNPDAGWFDVAWGGLGHEMSDSWFGFEENCEHGYCARVDFEFRDAARLRTLLNRIAARRGVVDATYESFDRTAR